ncbi:glycosyl hydrolase 108 family protein [uncultured Rhodospira sp.]|uniref:glycoside hydrolase family 108 protein n=1 Tax=uncultured Rhodospira sp. TaxID=1936189 RepID=UPI00261A2C13|nr:glycosyl hydrolase 108 family protein [uncultured Rhodospira sp.]
MAVYPDAFLAAMDAMFPHEGGFVDHPEDPGGATNLGITIGTLKEAVARGIVPGPATKSRLQRLTKREATKIYYVMYWRAVKADSLPAGVDYMVFDCQVNQGRGGLFLQKAINEWFSPKIEEDGVIGQETLYALNVLITKGRVTEADFVRDVAMHRLMHYSVLKLTFRRGWFRRALDVFRTATIQATMDLLW